jgi:hypothetical protein
LEGKGIKMFVVYRKKTGKIVKTFDKMSSARRSNTCMNRNAGDFYFACADYETYLLRNEVKEVTSLMTGKKVTIAVDTPRCCDPSSEAYWSM